MNYLDIEFWKQFEIKSEHNIRRYMNFIKLIQNKGKRELDYFEKHHIVPRSFIENDEIIILTAREHFIAHWILMRCFKNKFHCKMSYAFLKMIKSNHNRNYYKITSRIYEELRKNLAISQSLKARKSIWINDEINEKFILKSKLNEYLNSRWKIGRKEFSKDTKDNMRISGKRTYRNNKNILRKYNEGKIKKSSSFGTLNKIAVNNGINTKFIKNEDVEKFLFESPNFQLGSTSLSFKGKKHSEESKKKTSNSLKGRFAGNKNPMYGNHNKRVKQSLAISGRNNPCYGKKAINNGKISKFVLIEEVNNYLSEGWKLGYIKRNKEVI